MRAHAILVVVVGGCAYQGSSFHSPMQPFPGERATIGCVDLSIERRANLPRGEPVVAYAFGNRCDHPAVVDLANVTVVGRTRGGDQVELAAFDPRAELRVLRVDGRAVGHEAIAYPSVDTLRDVCVDAASITHGPAPHWMCFAMPPILPEVP